MKTRKIDIVCHRGANEYAPENTYASSQRCIDWQVDYLEVDINTSQDGVMYLFHGPALEHTTNGVGKIYEKSGDEIDPLDCGSWFDPAFADERIPRLDEFLEWNNHRIKLFFDVKWAPLDKLVKLIRDFNLQEECFFWFGRDKFAREFVTLAPDLAIKINVDHPEDVATARSAYGAQIVEFNPRQNTPDMREACRNERVRSMVLCPNLNTNVYQQVIDSGVDMVNLNHADHFIRHLKGDQGTSTLM